MHRCRQFAASARFKLITLGSRAVTRAEGWALFTTLFLQSKHTFHLMTAGVVHVTILTPGRDNPCSKNTVQLMTASMVHVTNLTKPQE